MLVGRRPAQSRRCGASRETIGRSAVSIFADQGCADVSGSRSGKEAVHGDDTDPANEHRTSGVTALASNFNPGQLRRETLPMSATCRPPL